MTIEFLMRCMSLHGVYSTTTCMLSGCHGNSIKFYNYVLLCCFHYHVIIHKWSSFLMILCWLVINSVLIKSIPYMHRNRKYSGKKPVNIWYCVANYRINRIDLMNNLLNWSLTKIGTEERIDGCVNGCVNGWMHA